MHGQGVDTAVRQKIEPEACRSSKTICMTNFIQGSTINLVGHILTRSGPMKKVVAPPTTFPDDRDLERYYTLK